MSDRDGAARHWTEMGELVPALKKRLILPWPNLAPVRPPVPASSDAKRSLPEVRPKNHRSSNG